jgi:hypothetical protein
MKSLLNVVLLIGGLILVAFGNDWGLVGMLPAFFQMLKEDIIEECVEPFKKG